MRGPGDAAENEEAGGLATAWHTETLLFGLLPHATLRHTTHRFFLMGSSSSLASVPLPKTFGNGNMRYMEVSMVTHTTHHGKCVTMYVCMCGTHARKATHRQGIVGASKQQMLGGHALS